MNKPKSVTSFVGAGNYAGPAGQVTGRQQLQPLLRIIGYGTWNEIDLHNRLPGVLYTSSKR